MRLLAVSVAAVLLTGCSGKSAGTDTRDCPPSVPSDGTPCSVESLACIYTAGSCVSSIVKCTSGEWHTSAPDSGCGDDAGSCPSTAPRKGEPCPGPASCSYACGDGGTLTATCPAGSWNLVASGCALP
jgi:hypothetical protein